MENPTNVGFLISGGERGIRTPGSITYNGFQDRRIKPLCHLSAGKISTIYGVTKNYLFLEGINNKKAVCFILLLAYSH
jgi:hypothetical protein